MSKRLKVYKRHPHEGFYVYSSSGCGDDAAIRLSHVECLEKTFELCISPEEAIELGNMIIEVALEYQKGIETGLEEHLIPVSSR